MYVCLEIYGSVMSSIVTFFLSTCSMYVCLEIVL